MGSQGKLRPADAVAVAQRLDEAGSINNQDPTEGRVDYFKFSADQLFRSSAIC